MTSRASAVFDIPAVERSTLRCTGCTQRACTSLMGTDGVGRVDCDGAAGTVRVDFDPDLVSEADLEAMLERFGLEFTEAYGHAAWRVEGLD